MIEQIVSTWSWMPYLLTYEFSRNTPSWQCWHFCIAYIWKIRWIENLSVQYYWKHCVNVNLFWYWLHFLRFPIYFHSEDVNVANLVFYGKTRKYPHSVWTKWRGTKRRTRAIPPSLCNHIPAIRCYMDTLTKIRASENHWWLICSWLLCVGNVFVFVPCFYITTGLPRDSISVMVFLGQYMFI